jgi:hypothetical protein
MTRLEYDDFLKQIQVEATQKKRELNVEYAMSLNAYSKGDKISDHMGDIIIEKIGVSNGFLGSMPQCVYYGLELKKDGKPRKDKRKREVYSSNVLHMYNTKQ